MGAPATDLLARRRADPPQHGGEGDVLLDGDEGIPDLSVADLADHQRDVHPGGAGGVTGSETIAEMVAQQKLQRHLRQKGYGDVEVRRLAAERPARTPIDHPFVGLVCEAARQVYGQEPVLIPSMGGTGPLYPFVKTLGLPTADCGVGYPESRFHAPDENIRLADLLRSAKHIAAVLERFATEQA